MSEQKISEQDKQKRLSNIINYFKSSTKTVSDLKELLECTSENRDESEKHASTKVDSIAHVDALVVLTSDALPDHEGLIEKYTLYKGIETKERTVIAAYQMMKPADGNRYSPIREEWKKRIAGKIQLNTELAKVLSYIKEFAGSQQKSEPDFKKFLTDIQSDGSAKNIIEDAIEKSKKKCVIFTGAPGTGKTYCVEKFVEEPMKELGFKKTEYFVQFHSSYDYTDFVEGLRPIQKSSQAGKDEMVFVRMDGIFKAFCRKVAEQNKQNQEDEAAEETRYYFVIDEINRADLGRVFGELMYCFEKRGEEHRIATQYANLPTCDKDGKPIGKPPEDKDGCFEDGFYIPGNVVIIGTMNNIDRSVETFDFALRRRFDWIEIEADAVMESSFTAMGIPTDILPKIRAKAPDDKEAKDGLNGIIEKQSGLGKDFKIGPAYFKDYNGKNLEIIWERNIEPILQEYMRGRKDAKDLIKTCEAALLLQAEDSV